jgi:hypothetical protein
MTGPPTILVDVSSATHGRPWEIEPHHIQPINRTHSTLVKFSYHDDDYERVLGTLRRLKSAAGKAIPRRATRLVPEVMGTDQLAPSLGIRSLPRSDRCQVLVAVCANSRSNVWTK